MCKGVPKLSQLWNGKKLEGLYDLRHPHCFQRSKAAYISLREFSTVCIFIEDYTYGNWINEFAYKKSMKIWQRYI